MVIESRAPLEKVRPLYERVYDAIKKALLHGELKPSQRLTETGVARWLHVSRTPVREAFRQLQREGLLEVSDKGHITVPLPDKDDIQDIFECRIALETTAARSAAQTITDDAAEKLSLLLDQSEQALNDGDILRAVEFSSQFHQSVAALSGNRRLVELLGLVWDQILLTRATVIREGGYGRDVVAEHRAILEALRAGRAQEAAARLESHIHNDTQRYVTRWKAAVEGEADDDK